jgi:uroporphyrinogen decarboxylase
VIEEGMRDVLRRAANRPGHIFNFGHAMITSVDPGLMRQLVDAVHEETKRP